MFNWEKSPWQMKTKIIPHWELKGKPSWKWMSIPGQNSDFLTVLSNLWQFANCTNDKKLSHISVSICNDSSLLNNKLQLACILFALHCSLTFQIKPLKSWRHLYTVKDTDEWKYRNSSRIWKKSMSDNFRYFFFPFFFVYDMVWFEKDYYFIVFFLSLCLSISPPFYLPVCLSVSLILYPPHQHLSATAGEYLNIQWFSALLHGKYYHKILRI